MVIGSEFLGQVFVKGVPETDTMAQTALILIAYDVSISVLGLPLFPNVMVNEGQLLKVTCVRRNIQAITTLQILNPNGVPVPTSLGVYNEPNVTRNFAGTYTCVVRSTLDNSTANATSTVVIQCKLDQSYIYREIFKGFGFCY